MAKSGGQGKDKTPAVGRDSGQPGGGKGRRDEVDQKHGLFPFSGPHPEGGDPELRARGSVSRAPYEESGRSELSEYEGELVGGAPPEELEREKEEGGKKPKP